MGLPKTLCQLLLYLYIKITLLVTTIHIHTCHFLIATPIDLVST